MGLFLSSLVSCSLGGKDVSHSLSQCHGCKKMSWSLPAMTPERHIPADGKFNRVTCCHCNMCKTAKRSFREELFLLSDLLQLHCRGIRLNKVRFTKATLQRLFKAKMIVSKHFHDSLTWNGANSTPAICRACLTVSLSSVCQLWYTVIELNLLRDPEAKSCFTFRKHFVHTSDSHQASQLTKL